MIKINKWSDKFENADTRKRQRLGWFLAPTGCDSKGYRQLMREGTPGIIALGVFQALCQVMGTLPKHVRAEGILSNSDGTGMELADIREITRMGLADIRHAVGILEKVGWISLLNQQSATSVPPTCHPSATSVPENSGFVKGEGEGEGEGEDERESASLPFASDDSPDLTEQAQTIVSAYPRRERVADALAVVLGDLRAGESFEALLGGTKAAAAVIRTMPSGASNRYVPGAAAFFAAKRWQDDPETLRRQGNTNTGAKGMSDDEALAQLGGRIPTECNS